MKLQSWVFVSGFSLMSSVFAANQHGHVNTTAKMMMPGNCEIEVINNTNEPVTVSGHFTDGYPFSSFEIYPHEMTAHIDLFNYEYGYCSQTMYVEITTFSGQVVYSRYVTLETDYNGNPRGQTIRLVPWLNAMVRAEVSVK